MDVKDILFSLMSLVAFFSVYLAFEADNQKVLVVPSTFQMDIYNVTMLSDCSFNRINGTVKMNNGSIKCDGWTDGHNIYLMQNLSKDRLKVVCNHEVLHTLITGMNQTREEELVREVDKYLNFSVCNGLFDR